MKNKSVEDVLNKYSIEQLLQGAPLGDKDFYKTREGKMVVKLAKFLEKQDKKGSKTKKGLV